MEGIGEEGVSYRLEDEKVGWKESGSGGEAGGFITMVGMLLMKKS